LPSSVVTELNGLVDSIISQNQPSYLHKRPSIMPTGKGSLAGTHEQRAHGLEWETIVFDTLSSAGLNIAKTGFGVTKIERLSEAQCRDYHSCIRDLFGEQLYNHLQFSAETCSNDRPATDCPDFALVTDTTSTGTKVLAWIEAHNRERQGKNFPTVPVERKEVDRHLMHDGKIRYGGLSYYVQRFLVWKGVPQPKVLWGKIDETWTATPRMNTNDDGSKSAVYYIPVPVEGSERNRYQVVDDLSLTLFKKELYNAIKPEQTKLFQRRMKLRSRRKRAHHRR